MKKKILFSMIVMLAFMQTNISAQTVYGSLTTGNWNSGTQWETYSTLPIALAASAGAGTASTSTTNPGGTHFILIRSGHTVSTNGSNRGGKGIVVQSGAKVWANEVTARRLQIGAGGTGFVYPLVDTVQVDGILGGSPTDGLYLETGAAAQLVKLYGTGAIDIQRLRIPGGAGSAAGGMQTLNIDMDMNLWQVANYAFSIKYNPAATDNYTLNLAAGKTIAIKTADGYFHNNSGVAAGNYTYNINGTVDLSASTQTTNNLTAFSSLAGTTNLNIAGILKTGAAFNSSPVSPGVDNLTINNAGIVDATLATVMNFTGNTFKIEGSGKIRRTVKADGSRSNFPVSTAFGGNNTVGISRDIAAGTSAVYDVNLQNTFTNAPADANLCVSKQWNISIFSGVASSSDTLRLSWLTTDQAPGFDPAGTVNIMHWNGTGWDYIPATVTGTGTPADPYIAKAFGISSYSPFGVTNSGSVLPVSLLSFTAAYNGTNVKLNWKTTNEFDVKKYLVQKSNDGRNFNTIGEVAANSANVNNEYNFVDASVISDKVYYRLINVDLDATFTYSNIISLNTKLKNQLQVYPNPTHDYITIVTEKSATQTSLQIISMDGKVLKNIIIEPGVLQTSIYIGNVAAGKYIVTTGGSSRKSITLIKQ